MNITKKRLADLNAAKYNPRKDLTPADPEYQHIKNSIETFGYIDPIIVNTRNNVIVGGHQRFKILAELGYDEADCVLVDMDEQEEMACNAALNKATGDWDEEKLNELLAELDAMGVDMAAFGFDVETITGDAFGDEFSLPDGDKPEICQMTFTLHAKQKELIEYAMELVSDDVEETFGNSNKNGNALYEVVRQWAAQKK